MAYSEYGDTSAMFSPAMGRIMQDDPDAAAEYLASLGVHPQQFQQVAQTTGGDTATDAPAPGYNSLYPPSPQTFIPSSGDISRPEDDPYRQPAVTPGMKKGQVDPKLSAGQIFGRAKDFYSNVWDKAVAASAPDPNSPLNVQKLFGTGGSAKPKPEKPTSKADDRVPESKPGRVPPEALNDKVADEPYTPSTKYATVEGGDNKPLPASDPRKVPDTATTEEVSAAKKKKEEAMNWLAGVRAPPAPPTPQLRPETGRAGAFPDKSPIVALLAGVLAGQAPGPELLRLAQAVGGK